jgi:hypothetical protein
MNILSKILKFFGFSDNRTSEKKMRINVATANQITFRTNNCHFIKMTILGTTEHKTDFILLVPQGNDFQITCVPDKGYKFFGWIIDGQVDQKNPLVMTPIKSQEISVLTIKQ